MLFTGIALGPIALVLMANYVSRLEERSAAKKVMVDGIERAPQLANWFARNGITAVARAGRTTSTASATARCRRPSS